MVPIPTHEWSRGVSALYCTACFCRIYGGECNLGRSAPWRHSRCRSQPRLPLPACRSQPRLHVAGPNLPVTEAYSAAQLYNTQTAMASVCCANNNQIFKSTRAMMTMRPKVRWDVLLVVTEADCVAIDGSTVGALSHPRKVAGGWRSVLLSREFVIARRTASLMSLAPCAASHVGSCR